MRAAAFVLSLLLLAAGAGAEEARVIQKRVNLRAQPNADSLVVWTLDRGAVVEVLERSSDWWRVRLPASGSTGYIRREALELLAAAGPAAPGAPPVAVIPAPTPPPAPKPKVAAAPAKKRAKPERRFRLHANGAFGVMALDFSEDRTFKEFAEDGRLEAKYEAGSGPGFEGGLQYLFTRSLGVAASVSVMNRDETGSFTAFLPHPLYLDRDREVSGDLSGFSYTETAVHLDLVYTGGSKSLGYSLFAGPTFFQVKPELIEGIRYTHNYPFDTVILAETPSVKASDSPIGFNLGAGLDYKVNPSFAIGAQLRFSRGSGKVSATEGSTVDVDAGGLHLGVGARVSF